MRDDIYKTFGGSNIMQARTVVGIPVSYDARENLEFESTKKYLNYLENNQVDTVMTTEGTSNFSLLSTNEIHDLNKSVVQNFKGNKIVGVPSLSLRDTVSFVERAKNYLDNNSSLMFLYPERFYNEKIILEYFRKIKDATGSKIYIHGKSIRSATGGNWHYNSDVVNALYKESVLKGIKEEHPNLLKSYDFVSNLEKDIDVIVAGGSMRRYEYLNSAGANSFLSGVGNLFPSIEQEYINGNKYEPLEKEKKIFSIFMKIGWHKSLRISLKYLDLTCYNNRSPWPSTTEQELRQISKAIEEIK